MNYDMETVSPESLGFSSEWVENFMNKIDEDNICMHSFLMMRYGKIGAEGYYGPFGKDKLHRMYSVTKSFVSLAIGLLASEGKINLDNKIVDIFKHDSTANKKYLTLIEP